MSTKPKFIFFGTPRVASETLEALIAHDLIPAAVVTAPDAPRGRGLVRTPSPTKEVTEKHGIPLFTPETLDTACIASLKEFGAVGAVAVAYGKLFPKELIMAFPQGVLNVHYSLLPKYRGATPLEGALLAGEPETGVTVQKMVLALDEGDIVSQEVLPIAPTETARELRPRLIALGTKLLIDTLPKVLAGTAAYTPQESAHATYTKKLKKEDGLLALSDSAEENWNKYRAYADTIGTHFFKDGKRIKVVTASYKDGVFMPERVIPEGKREMDFSELT